MNVAEKITEILIAEGVRVAAGIAGETVDHLATALHASGQMNVCCTRQERVAVDLCDGYARVSGKVAAMFADRGPGVANAMAGIANSYSDSSPVLFFAGASPRFDIPGRGYKELPIHEVYKPVTRWIATIIDPSQVNDVLRRAFTYLRTGRTGPVIIGIPDGLSVMEAVERPYRPAPPKIRTAGDPALIEKAVQVLASAQRPYVCVGGGVLLAQASQELVDLAELLSLPVATTLNGKSAFPENHALALGMGGVTRGTYSTLQAVSFAREADVVLTIGCSYQGHSLKDALPQGATLIQIDADPYELGKKLPADVSIVGDAKLVLQQMVDAARSLLPATRRQPRDDVKKQIHALREEWLGAAMPLLTSSEVPIQPYRIVWELSRIIDSSNTIVLHDSGSVRESASLHYVATVPRSFLGFGVQSAMGWSLGAALGAKLAAPDKLVVAITGDEAFGETGFDLETAAFSDIPILVILNNNRGYPRDPKKQAIQGFRTAHVRPFGDYCALACALGVRADRVEHPDMLRGTLAAAVEHVRAGKSAFVEVVTKRVKAG